MSDRVMVMHQGVIDQIGTPFEVYNRPATRFVASFVGTLSVIEGTVADKAKGAVNVGFTTFLGISLPNSASNGGKVILALRPETLRREARQGDVALSGMISAVDFLGSVIRISIDAGANSLTIDMFNDPGSPPPVVGAEITVHVAPDNVLVLQD